MPKTVGRRDGWKRGGRCGGGHSPRDASIDRDPGEGHFRRVDRFFNDGHTPPPLAAIREGARRARVVVGVHWGAEYGPVTDRQRLLARQLAAAGATLIVGSGPHVLQGTERIGTTLVLYSLGNLLLDQPYPLARLGAVVRVTVEEDGIHACAVPTRYRAGRVTPAPGKERAKALARLGLPACTEAR